MSCFAQAEELTKGSNTQLGTVARRQQSAHPHCEGDAVAIAAARLILVYHKAFAVVLRQTFAEGLNATRLIEVVLYTLKQLRKSAWIIRRRLCLEASLKSCFYSDRSVFPALVPETAICSASAWY